jgi:hypothetical protein
MPLLQCTVETSPPPKQTCLIRFTIADLFTRQGLGLDTSTPLAPKVLQQTGGRPCANRFEYGHFPLARSVSALQSSCLSSQGALYIHNKYRLRKPTSERQRKASRYCNNKVPSRIPSTFLPHCTHLIPFSKEIA